MAEDTKYEYRRHEASLLRAPADAEWRREIFRPETGDWEKYDYSGGIEEWHHGYVVEPDAVGDLTESLKKLEGSR